MTLPKDVEIVEVGARDGLQNEKQILALPQKLELLRRLSRCGFKSIEATSFVSPKWIPQFADAKETLLQLEKKTGIAYPVLVPNLKGFHDAIEAGAKVIAVFTAVSETFSKKNTNCSIDESLKRIEEVFAAAKKARIKVRGYISCVIACPYEGYIDPARSAEIAKFLFDHGAYEISLGDTIGIGDPLRTRKLIETVAKKVPIKNLAGHFHNTYGMALANIYASLELGVRVFDASIGGLGGCPYAKGATGNVPTEEVVFMMDSMGIKTGVDLREVIQTAQYVRSLFPNCAPSKIYQTMSAAFLQPQGHPAYNPRQP